MTTAQLIDAEAEFAARHIGAFEILLTHDDYYGTWVEARDAQGEYIAGRHLYGGEDF